MREGGHLKLSSKDVVPNLACDTETQLEVLVVMFEMILLHTFHVLRQFGVVHSVVHAIVHNVHGKATRDDTVSYCLREQGMCQLGEWVAKYEEEQRWHDQSQSIHG